MLDMGEAMAYYREGLYESPQMITTKDTYLASNKILDYSRVISEFLFDYCIIGSSKDYILSSELEAKFKEVYSWVGLKPRQFSVLMNKMKFASEKIGFRKIPEDRGKYGYRGLKKKFDW